MERSSFSRSRYAQLLNIMRERGEDVMKEHNILEHTPTNRSNVTERKVKATNLELQLESVKLSPSSCDDSLSTGSSREKIETRCNVVQRGNNIVDLGMQQIKESSNPCMNSLVHKDISESQGNVEKIGNNMPDVETQQEQVSVSSSGYKSLSNFSDNTSTCVDNKNIDEGETSKYNSPTTDRIAKGVAVDKIFHNEVKCPVEYLHSQNIQNQSENKGLSNPLKNKTISQDDKSYVYHQTSTPIPISFMKAKEQLQTFCQRIRVCHHTQSLLPYKTRELDLLSKLEEHTNQLRLATSPSDLTDKISSFSQTLRGDRDLSAIFLTNFLGYIRSVLNLKRDVTSVSEILEYLVPCINIVLRSGICESLVNSIKNGNLLPNIYNLVIATFNSGARYSETSIRNLVTYQCRANKSTTTKAHVVRMSPQESLAAFQETFGDKGSHSDLYLIYVWQVFRIYEVTGKEESGQPLVHSITESIEETGKYINIMRAKEIQAREKTDPFLHQPRGKTEALKLTDKATESPHPVPEANFEWADFCLGQVYANGVAFMVNSVAWVDRLREISSDIEKLEVKKAIKSIPSLGSTLGYRLQNGINVLDAEGNYTYTQPDLVYIRVRVVRTAGPVVRVYGVDTGTVHTCPTPQHLILLPQTLIQVAPCGRLARLPVLPSPTPQLVAPLLALLTALCHRPDLAQDLCAIDIRPLASLLQVQELTQLTLNLLEELIDALPASHLLPHIALVIADYLMRGAKYALSSTCINLATSILTTIMNSSPKIRLLLAREGIFTTLCETALSSDDHQQVWESILVLLGGRAQVEKWAALTHRAHDVKKKRYQRVPKTTSCSTKHNDSSMPVVQLANMTAPDRNWDLEVRHSLTTRQLIEYQSRTEWQWQKGEVVASDMGRLHYGHLLNVRIDQTHHLILDKSVPNIRMNTLLQIILGMLNSGLGGKVYIGLSEVGVVQGVKMTRDQRDCFRLGFSKLVTSEITPSLLPCDSLIQIVPVIRTHPISAFTQTSSILPSYSSESDFFIIVLTVLPQSGLVYRCRDDPVPVVSRGEGGASVTLRGALLKRTLNHAQQYTQLRQRTVAGEKENLMKAIKV